VADICILVEGAYPYVTGGVSSWLHALITNLTDLTFALVHVGARPDPQRKPRYTLPKNVVEYREVFTSDITGIKKSGLTRRPRESEQTFLLPHEAIALGKPYKKEQLYTLLQQPGLAGLTSADLLYGARSWDFLIELYKTYAPQQAFVDFFWTFRQTYLPIFRLAEVVLPEADVYHAVSTGFCGLLGALVKLRHDRPFLITEHGIYTREREIEISQSLWLEQLGENQRDQLQRMNFFQAWWLNIYRFMELIAYDMADSVISITGVNQHYQVAHGADASKLRLIPNGIDIARLDGLRLEQGEDAETFQVGFVGRIVSIKDVKTMIRAAKIASETIPDLQVYLVGPTDEEKDYYQKCQQLVSMLNLEKIVHFTGSTDVKAYYKKIDVLVLTSLSEGQPLVILEGNCAGIPVVASNVGACRELLEGVTAEDQALGASGLITPVASPQATAQAIIQLWRDKDLRLRLGQAGRERVRRFYRQEQLYSTYTDLYQQYINGRE